LAYWLATFAYLFSIPESTDVITSDDIPIHFNVTARNLMYYMIFGFFWTTAFLSAVMQHSVAGAMSTWYFSRNNIDYKQSRFSSPAFQALFRSFTTSFGSLAFGSLILAVVQFINYLVQQSKQANRSNKVVWCILCCIQCCLGCLQGFISFLNTFAYIYVAMYGESFCTSARNCFNLLSRNAWSAIAVDAIGDFVLFVGNLFGAALTTLVAIAIANYYHPQESVSFITIGSVALGSFFIFRFLSLIIGTGVDTVMVCYLEDLERNKDGQLMISPDLHRMISERAGKARGEHK